MKIIFGLGNKGKVFLNTRHNLGQWFLDKLQEDSTIKDYIKKSEIVLIKNSKFMNEAGVSVKKALDQHQTPFDNLLVIHDDWDLPFGSCRLQKGKNSAGHKGVQSIIDALETKDFWRLRIGIGPGPREGREEFVLGKLGPEERRQLRLLLPKLIDSARNWLT